MKRRLGFLIFTLAFLADAGGRTPYGGTLRLVSVGASEGLSDIATSMLSATPLCRVADISPIGPRAVRVVPTHSVSAEALAMSLGRLTSSRLPAAAVLWGASVAVRDGTVELRDVSAAGDIISMACHPALSVRPGSFAEDAGVWVAVPSAPTGRPYLDRVTVSLADVRTGERLLAQRRADVLIGAGGDTSGAMLFATYLVLRDQSTEHLKQSLDATVDRADLTRFFVQAPAAPLASVLPPAAGGQIAPALTARPAPLSAPQSIAVMFSSTAAEHRAIAERLQVKLATMGYRVRLEPVAKTSLRGRWSQGDGDVLIESILLPPASAPAWVAVHALAGHTPAELPLDSTRDALARERSMATSTLPLVPLCVQGLALGQSPAFSTIRHDAFGLPQLDEAFALPTAP